MLKSTFQHLKGVGKKIEKVLWEKGFTTWEAYDAFFQRQPSLFSRFPINTPLRESMEAYEKGDMAYFANTLPTAEYYRVALEFPQDVIFLDCKGSLREAETLKHQLPLIISVLFTKLFHYE